MSQDRVELDFPVSDSFARYEAWLNGEMLPDLGPEEPPQNCIARAEEVSGGLRIYFDVKQGFGFQNIEGGDYIRPLQPRGPDGRIL